MVSLVIAVLVVLLGSALCSGSEVALLSVPAVRAQQVAEEGSRRARALWAIKQDLTRPIAAIVVLNNVFNIVGSIAVGTIAADVFGEQWIGVVSGVLTFLVILFAEILPKTLAERHAERVGLWIAVPVQAVTALLTPVVGLFELLMRPLTRGDRPPSTSEAEIRLLAGIGHSEGIIEDDEVEMIRRIFNLNDRTAKDLMTPRTAVTWLDTSRSVAEARTDIMASEHTRIVVAEGGVGDAVGFALKHELLAALLDDGSATVGQCIRPVSVVPWLVPADDLLRRFQRDREHLALVINEHGDMIGVVTLEDVLEVLTGPILDETDRRPDLRAHARARWHARMRS